MIKNFMRKLSKFLDSPFTNLGVALILLFTCLWEVGDTLFDDIIHFNFRVHHGIIILSLYKIVDTIPHFYEIFEHLDKGVNKN